MNYKKLLEKYEDMELYHSVIPVEYSVDVAEEVGKVLNIKVDEKMIEDAWDTKEKEGKKTIVCITSDETFREYVYLDRSKIDYLDEIIVRCKKNKSKQVKEVLYKWEMLARKDYCQVLPKKGAQEYYLDITNNDQEKHPLYISLSRNGLI